MEAMATKSERFRYEAQRAGAPAKPTKKNQAKAKAKGKKAATHGSAKARKATVAFEETPPAVAPSRKSTRRSMHRQKGATALTGRTLLSKNTPQARHDMGSPTLRAPR
jgi:hypothetical protein